jgi:hypothetical protein
LANPRAFGPLEAAGDFFVRAYSEQNGVKNATVTPTVVVNGAAINPTPPPPPFNVPGYFVSTDGAPIQVPTGRFMRTINGRMREIFVPLGPTAGPINKIGPGSFDKASWLKVANDQVTIASRTGQYLGDASAFINPVGQRLLLAGATVSPPLPPRPGAAAGLATDPFFVPSSGSPLLYDPVLNDRIQLETRGISGGALSWAVDSSVFTSDSVDNFVRDGAPLDKTLWFLAIGAQGPIGSRSDVGIDFEINPQALNEITFPSRFLAGLGPFSNAASVAALIDQAVNQAVAAALTPNGNEVDLRNFDPFPAGTTFSAASGGVQYADGVNAGITGAPEPGTWLLLATGLLGLLGMGRQRRKPSVA